MIYLAFDSSQLSFVADEKALFFLDLALKATAILLATVALNFALRRTSAATRHLLWSLSLTGLLALPALTYGLPSWRVSVLPESLSIDKNDAADLHSEAPPSRQRLQSSHKAEREARAGRPVIKPTKGNTELNQVALIEQPHDAEAPAEAASVTAPRWGRWILVIWLAGFLISLGRLLLGLVSIWSLSRRANEMTDPAWTTLAVEIGEQLGLRRRVLLVRSTRVAMPQTWGTLRPAILLPAEADDWPRERRQVVLLHELAHVKRKDCLTQTMAQLACAFYWFNPLVWMALRRLRIERELACDDQVLKTGTRASDYAGLLLDVARSLRSGSCSSLTAVAMARRSQLEGRLLAILDPSLNRKGLNRGGSSLVVLALALIIVPLASLHPTAQTTTLSPSTSETAETVETRAKPLYEEAETRTGNPNKHASAQDSEIQQEEPIAEPAEVDLEEAETAEEPAQQEQKQSGQSKSIAVQALLDALKDEDGQVRAEALNALAQAGGSDAVEALKQAMSSDDWRVRQQAAWGLGLHGDQSSIDLLVTALRDRHAGVRTQAAWALGLKGDNRAVEQLIAALKDDDAKVRVQAAWALGLKGDDRAVDGLIVALKDSIPDVRAQAAWALGMRGAQRAIVPLNEARKDEHPQVRKTAAWALGMLLINTRDPKIRVKIDSKVKIDNNLNPDEIEVELDDIDIDPNPDPEDGQEAKPVKPRRRERTGRGSNEM